MLSLDAEIGRLRDERRLDPDRAATLIAIERGNLFSLHLELRLLLYAAVVAIVTGVGVVLSKNLDRIGPVTLIAGIGLVAAACYLYAWIMPRRQARELSLLESYVLLLGALLVSTDVGYAESQFHLFGSDWSRYLLLLAIFHGATAYLYRSKLLLTVSITSLAAWFGIERNIDTLWDSTPEMGLRALACAAVVFVWRVLDRRFSRAGFTNVFDHAVANLALLGALFLVFDDSTRWIGLLLLTAGAGFTIFAGFRNREEIFLVYGVVYLLIGAGEVVTDLLHEEVLEMLWFLVTTATGGVWLFMMHLRLREGGS
ncbi:MAG: DUF2157 domain-containing protein [Thermoanaerobaculia bacterium]